MASEIRVNKINSQTGVGTITLSPTGVDISGITTVSTLKVGTGVTASEDGDIFFTGVCTATTFTGSGANLTNLPAANLSGTLPAISAANLTNVPAANITGTLPAISAANLTNVPAANVTGTLPAVTAANLTNIPAANIVGLATAGFERSGGFGGGIEMVDMWRLHTEYTIPHNSTTVISTANWERPDTTNDGFTQLGTGMSVDSGAHADGVWTFPSTGFYLVSYGGYCYNPSNDPYEVFVRLEMTEDGSSFGLQGRAYLGGERYNYNGGFAHIIADVTDVSTHKFRMRVYSAVSDSRLHGDSSGNRQYVSFIRLGDT